MRLDCLRIKMCQILEYIDVRKRRHSRDAMQTRLILTMTEVTVTSLLTCGGPSRFTSSFVSDNASLDEGMLLKQQEPVAI